MRLPRKIVEKWGILYEKQCFQELQIYVKDNMQGFHITGMAEYFLYSYQ